MALVASAWAGMLYRMAGGFEVRTAATAPELRGRRRAVGHGHGATAFRQWGQYFLFMHIVHCVLAEFQWGQ